MELSQRTLVFKGQAGKKKQKQRGSFDGNPG